MRETTTMTITHIPLRRYQARSESGAPIACLHHTGSRRAGSLNTQVRVRLVYRRGYKLHNEGVVVDTLHSKGQTSSDIGFRMELAVSLLMHENSTSRNPSHPSQPQDQ